MKSRLNGSTAYGFEYDFFLKDHLGNTRMVLTQEKDTAQYIATMEAAYRATENQLFYNIPQTSYAVSAISGYPSDPTTNPNDSVARVNGSGPEVGPSILLRVMSGDVVDLACKSFYKSGGTVPGPNSTLTNVLNSLAGGLFTATSGAHGAITDLTNTSTSPVYAALNSFLPANDPNTTTTPKAYLNWILLNDQFQGVNTYPQSGAIPVGTANVLNTLAYTGIPITKNGYLYIWVSNETPGWDVFFDNLSVKHYSSPITEETHYYPFGLTMAGISSLTAVGLENKIKFQKQELQHKEFSDGSGLETYQFRYRMDDPQTGRFWQIDPLADKYVYNSTYAFSENRVIDGRELEGLEWAAVNDSKGKTISRQLTVSITNNSQINDKQFNKFITYLQKNFAKTYGADGAKTELLISDKATIKVSLVDTKSTLTKDINGNEAKTFSGGVTATLGKTQNNSFTVSASVDKDNISSKDMSRAFEHEAGHTAGLMHPFDPQQNLLDIKQGAKGVKSSTVSNNLMNSDANATNPSNNGKELTKSQFDSLDKLIESQEPKN